MFHGMFKRETTHSISWLVLKGDYLQHFMACFKGRLLIAFHGLF